MPGVTDPLVASNRVRRRVASVEAAAIAGLICGVGWAAAFIGLTRAPGVDASDAEVVAYYADAGHGDAVMLWMQVLVVATIAFLWFVGVVRGRVGDREPKLFGTVFFGASILLAGVLFVGGALLAAPAAQLALGGRAPDPGAASATRAAAAVLLSVVAPRVATLVMLSTAGLGRVTGALPRWLVWLTYAVGVVMFLNVSISTPNVLVVPAWVAVVSVVLLVRRPSHGFELEADGRVSSR